MTDRMTIREASARLGIPRKAIFHLLIRKQLGYMQLEPDGPYLLSAAEIERVQEAGLRWARAWGEAYERLHPTEDRIDLLSDWGCP